jgi:hypothetical protein
MPEGYRRSIRAWAAMAGTGEPAWLGLARELQRQIRHRALRTPARSRYQDDGDGRGRCRRGDHRPVSPQAKDLMFGRTDTKVSPWYVVNSDNKKQARLNCIAHLLSRVPYKDLNPIETSLPPRQSDSDYKRPKITSQRFVPDIY